MSRGWLALVAGVAAASLSLTSCTAGAGRHDAAVPTGPDVGLEHVHGLGVDPADGVLYAASHFGLWRIPEGEEATRVANRFQDTMGFTVVGPGTFLASGHPDFRMDPDLPTRLGLIRSTDEGRTWQSISLSGEADFHELQAAHGNVYGWDAASGRLLVSADDGRTWETRSTLGLRDLVVGPGDPLTLLATTEVGLVRSGDGGRTWEQVPGAPSLAVVAWPSVDSTYGVTADGVVQHSDDGGRTWIPRGTVGGEPEALAVPLLDGVERLYVAVSGRGILASDDGGATFTVRYAE